MDRRTWFAGMFGLPALAHQPLYSARPLTGVGSFSENIEGPSCDGRGFLFVPNFARDHTLGRISPTGSDGSTIYVTEAEHRRLVSFRVETAGAEWQRLRRIRK